MPKYRDYFRKMLDENNEAFDKFSEVHNKYMLDQQSNQEEYNAVGRPVRIIVEDYERKLCGYSEKGHYAQYSSKLAEKFQEEVKAFFPMFNFIGVKVQGPALTLPTVKVAEPKAQVDPDISEIDDMDIDSFEIPKLF